MSGYGVAHHPTMGTNGRETPQCAFCIISGGHRPCAMRTAHYQSISSNIMRVQYDHFCLYPTLLGRIIHRFLSTGQDLG
jgi:hypothetical protein